MALLGIILWLKFLLASAYQLYLFQLKEYRFDRLKEHVFRLWPDWKKRLWFFGLGAPVDRGKLPKPSFRALAFYLFQVGFALTGVLFLFGGQKLIWLVLLNLFPLAFLFASLANGLIDWVLVQGLILFSSRVIEQWKKNGTKIIAVTGSYGKTTTVSFLTTLLREKYFVLTPALGTNVEKAIGLWVLKNRKRKADLVALELGAYKRGEIKSLVSWLKPEIAFLTGIGNQHLALFRSQENIVKAKSEVLAFAETAFFNADCSQTKKIATAFKGRKVFYGLTGRGEYQLLESREIVSLVKEKWQGKQRAVIVKGKKRWSGLVPFIRKEFLLNLTGAVALADFLGLSRKKIEAGFSQLILPQGRIEIKTSPRGSLILDSTHNQSETSVLAGLGFLKETKQFKKKIVIISCLIELGKETRVVHRRLGKELAQAADQIFVAGSECFDHFLQGAGKENQKFSLIKSNKEISSIINNSRRETVIFLSGRLGINLEQ